MKMNVENKLDKVVKILKEKGFVVYRKGGKEPGVFYAKEGDSRILLLKIHKKNVTYYKYVGVDASKS